MPEVRLEKIPQQWRARVQEFALLAGVSKKEVYARMKPGDGKEVTWAFEDGHRTIDVSRSPGVLFEGIKNWQHAHAAPPGCKRAASPTTAASNRPDCSRPAAIRWSTSIERLQGAAL